ncbi:MAG: 30S ribosomal protein S9 [Patescibacteria group bacterium]
MKDKQQINAVDQTNKSIQFNGPFISAIGRRKTAVAQVRLYKGKGIIVVNNMPLKQYFSSNCIIIVNQPLKLTTHLKDLDFSILIKGGGKQSQAEAARHGISKALISLEKDLKQVIKIKGWLTRDSRKKERKKPGLKKARKAPQWSKR